MLLHGGVRSDQDVTLLKRCRSSGTCEELHCPSNVRGDVLVLIVYSSVVLLCKRRHEGA